MRKFAMYTVSIAALVACLRPAIAPAAGPTDTIYVVNSNSSANSVGAYTTSGSAINTALITGLSNPVGIAASGGNLFVTNQGLGTVGEYTTSGAVVNATLIKGGTNVYGIAVS